MKISWVIKEDVEWFGRANFASKLFDSVKELFQSFSMIKYSYEPCLKVAMLCVFALCSLIVFIVISKEVTPLLRRLKGF